MGEKNFLTDRFEAERGRLSAVAFRMLGSRAEAEDAVQEAWLRLERAGGDGIDNPAGWLTTVVGRICLDMLRARTKRREDPIDGEDGEMQHVDPRAAADEQSALADSVGLALLVVLERLAPAERLAFVLHDMFDVPFEEIGRIVGRTPVAARQLASRARRRVQGLPETPSADYERRKRVVAAFLTASRDGDFSGLLAVLDPEVVFHADADAVRLGSLAEIHGAQAVATTFKGKATAARLALIDGNLGLAVILGGELRIVVRMDVDGDQIVAIDSIADPARIAAFEVVYL
ncbi:sigma-70 family RNA polymerase sigma factor [Shinella kummerowiae]|jgi:RNA polymerase sigma factor (sigma-70 family)|uniref:Sigma-70 family RNA polymerase sigma factor n=1 Tax=Shinella kummerowiae TaxID=417745 RepID=A0A6N8SM91_9HYPH|nr:sigma-70 family RNA polymerase sigma factor [Shinella kummerowiae]MXN47970.1 sigma-70 family RNA polymerase sigma factor [Shinella kummerowiae]